MLELNLYTFPDWNVDLVGGLVCDMKVRLW